MPVITRVRRQGGAAIITIPSSVLKLMNVDVGEELSLDVSEQGLVAKPVKTPRRRYSREELLEGADELRVLNRSLADALDGDPVGHEL